MDSLIKLSHLLQDTKFVGDGGGGCLDHDDDSRKNVDQVPARSTLAAASSLSPFLGRFCWLVVSYVNRVLQDARSGSSASSRRRFRLEFRCIEDFLTMSVEQFIGRYANRLAALSFADRRLLIATKYRLTSTLERTCPASLTAAAAAAGNNGGGLCGGGGSGGYSNATDRYGFARCFFTVASIVPCTDDDYHTLTTGGYKCTCGKQQQRLCQYCIRTRSMVGNGGGSVNAVTALQLANRTPENPYDPPNPFTWIKLQEERQQGLIDDTTSGGGSLLSRFRRQTIQKDVYETWKRVHSDGRAVVLSSARPGLPPTYAAVQKFRPSSLPSSLKHRQKHQRRRSRQQRDPNNDIDFYAIDHQPQAGQYERDLGTLLSHFAINWSKLHYLEPNIVPQFGDGGGDAPKR